MKYFLISCCLTSLLTLACGGGAKPGKEGLESGKVENDPDVFISTSLDSSLMRSMEDSLAKTIEEDTLKEPSSATDEIVENLLLYEENGFFGYKNEAGEIVLTAQYEMANDFVSGMAEVVDEKGWAYINAKGAVIARPFIYDNGPDYFREGLARFTDKNKIGFLNERGEKIIPADFDFANPFEYGFSTVCIGCKAKKVTRESGEYWTSVGGKWGIINKDGAWVLPCEYAEVKTFGKGVVGYKEAGKWVKKNVK